MESRIHSVIAVELSFPSRRWIARSRRTVAFARKEMQTNGEILLIQGWSGDADHVTHYLALATQAAVARLAF